MPRSLQQTNARTPTFLIAALKDPLEAELERVQIIKGWTEDGEAHEKIYDVACANGRPPDETSHRCSDRAAAPDLDTCIPHSSEGSKGLRGWWRDPEFEAEQRAFYYVRVLQIPTCRWSTWDAIRLGVQPHPMVPPTIQERAITSPIWYEPRHESHSAIERGPDREIARE